MILAEHRQVQLSVFCNFEGLLVPAVLFSDKTAPDLPAEASGYNQFTPLQLQSLAETSAQWRNVGGALRCVAPPLRSIEAFAGSDHWNFTAWEHLSTLDKPKRERWLPSTIAKNVNVSIVVKAAAKNGPAIDLCQSRLITAMREAQASKHEFEGNCVEYLSLYYSPGELPPLVSPQVLFGLEPGAQQQVVLPPRRHAVSSLMPRSRFGDVECS